MSQAVVSIRAAFVAFCGVCSSTAVDLGPWGHPHLVVYLISAQVVPPCACVVFAVL